MTSLMFIMIGSQCEPFNLEALNSSKYTDFVERTAMADTFVPCRIRTGIAGHCVRGAFAFGVELAGSLGPFSVQAEYTGAQVNRNMTNIMLARVAGEFAPGGSSEYFSGRYVEAQYWLAGEERVSAHSVKDRNGASSSRSRSRTPSARAVGPPGASLSDTAKSI